MKSRQESGKIASEAVIFKYEISEGVWKGIADMTYKYSKFKSGYWISFCANAVPKFLDLRQKEDTFLDKLPFRSLLFVLGDIY